MRQAERPADAGKRGPRAAAKAATEQLLLSSGITALARRRRRADVLILAYHNVVPDDTASCGDEPLHLSRSRFAAQLDLLAETHDVVPLADALTGRAGRRDRPRAVITFDDAYRGALTLGAAELALRRMPATVFVAPAFVGGAAFWWDRVVLPPPGEERSAFRTRALEECAGRDAAVRELALQCGFTEREVPSYARCASEWELTESGSSGTFTLGSHSWSHPNLAAVSGSVVREELARPLVWLRGRFMGVLPVLAYPYGRFSDATVAAARAAGYSAALRNDGGWLRRGQTDALRTPRVDIPSGLSSAGFALRAAGLVAV
ncbi:MAG: polysaccharide deacetylase family protein [Gemmatimonadaceae bacterium]